MIKYSPSFSFITVRQSAYLSLSFTELKRFSQTTDCQRTLSFFFPSVLKEIKTLMKSTVVFLVNSFAGAGDFKFLEKREETNKEKAMRLLQQLKKNLLYIMTWQKKNLSNLQWQSKKIISVNKTLDWSCFRAVDFKDSALTTTGEFHFYMIKDKHSHS